MRPSDSSTTSCQMNAAKDIKTTETPRPVAARRSAARPDTGGRSTTDIAAISSSTARPYTTRPTHHSDQQTRSLLADIAHELQPLWCRSRQQSVPVLGSGALSVKLTSVDRPHPPDLPDEGIRPRLWWTWCPGSQPTGSTRSWTRSVRTKPVPSGPYRRHPGLAPPSLTMLVPAALAADDIVCLETGQLDHLNH